MFISRSTIIKALDLTTDIIGDPEVNNIGFFHGFLTDFFLESTRHIRKPDGWGKKLVVP